MPKSSASKPSTAISALSVKGFKSIADEQSIEVRPLTILAGANSSGKSSMMQPLLLLKQTLEAQYDPGPLLLNGPNVKFTSVGQIIPVAESSGVGKPHLLSVAVRLSGGIELVIEFSMHSKSIGIRLESNTLGFHKKVRKNKNQRTPTAWTPGIRLVPPPDRGITSSDSVTIFDQATSAESPLGLGVSIRNRCFFEVGVTSSDLVKLHAFETDISSYDLAKLHAKEAGGIVEETTRTLMAPAWSFREQIQDILHIAGLRGNPARSYPMTDVGPRFPGTFDNYVASLIAHWSEADIPKLQGLNEDLQTLGLTWKVEAKSLNDAQVELRVGRLRKAKRGGGKDLVNIADVGFGVSQTLPVVVALRAANPGQLVYIEQPEIHLHPRAQVAMAEVLAKAAARGVRVVVETHSSLLLLAVQTLVAQGSLDSKLVKLNWFSRDDEGATHIHAAELDEAGRFGDWPEDFADVALEAEDRYLTAAERRLIEDGVGG